MVEMTRKGKKNIQFQLVNEDWMVLNITPKMLYYLKYL